MRAFSFALLLFQGCSSEMLAPSDYQVRYAAPLPPQITVPIVTPPPKPQFEFQENPLPPWARL